jgi:MFS family permease
MSSENSSGSSAFSPWWKLLTRYHWFVLVVAALGWMFDCLDQQLFNLARKPAMEALIKSGQNPDLYGGYATAIFLIGWATGGLTFGVLGDRIGRAKTMMWTILIYSLCTGLSALSVGFWDFAFYRFITGLGVGGEFAVGVSLVAEVMPDRARPFALGLLQALSAVGNVTAALLSMTLGWLEETGTVGSAWRWMFVIGALPALLALIVRMRLKEPERWKAAKAAGEKRGQQFGSYAELFGNPNWRPPAVVAGGLIVLLLVMAFAAPPDWPKLGIGAATALLAVAAGLWSVYGGGGHSPWRRNAMIGLLLACSGVIGLWGIGFFSIDLQRTVFRSFFVAQGLTPKELAGKLTFWTGITSMMINFGAFLGMLTFSKVASILGRRPTFAIAFIAAMLSTASVFWFLRPAPAPLLGKLTFWQEAACLHQVFWLIPLMGFCLLSVFGGYAIYFPELFPTRLRSTGTSFCYNVGRFAAASGPALLGLLTSKVFSEANGFQEGMRYAGVSMCAIFFLGLLVLPFAPETKGKSLPEDERGFAH